jgi:hypothetical protein
LNETAPPGQLLCECQALPGKRVLFFRFVHLISEPLVGAVGNLERFSAEFSIAQFV